MGIQDLPSKGNFISLSLSLSLSPSLSLISHVDIQWKTKHIVEVFGFRC